MIEDHAQEERWYADQEVKPEQIVSLLRQIEVAVANGKATPRRSGLRSFQDYSLDTGKKVRHVSSISSL